MRYISYLFLSIMLLGISPRLYAQRFDWVTGGGTSYYDDWLFSHPEATYYMCSDANGNIYALSNVANGEVTADTFSSYPYGSDQNLLISSYDCSGQMRWAKLIASSADIIYPYGIVSDTLGHIYLAGEFKNATLYIGTDTSISGLQYLINGLIQFDTNGHFNWIRYVGDNDLNNLESSAGFGSTITMDGSGRVHFINFMKTGVHVMPGLISQYGDYDLIYDTSGTLINATRLGMDSVWYVDAATIDPATNKLYVVGQRNQGIIDTFCAFAAGFDAERNMMWMDTIGHDAAGFGSIIYDKMGHLYLAGGSVYACSLNSYQIPPGYNSFLFKTDMMGNPEWGHFLNGTINNVNQ